MSYLHHPYAFSGHAAPPIEQPVGYEAAMPPAPMMTPAEGYLFPHPPYEMAEFYPPPGDYEEYTENLSRPRLTKEQVDTLEAQFQAHPKPNSSVKRQLAIQTNLTLPRVANWFQNRRAKAKQQKRQEEYERMQREQKEQQKGEQNKSESTEQPSENKETPENEKQQQQQQETTPTQTSTASVSGDQSNSKTPGSSAKSKHQKTRSEACREATFASLQRALNAAVAARDQFSHETEQNVPPPQASGMEMSPQQSSMFQSGDGCQSTLNQPFSEWGNNRDSSVAWTPSQSPEETFGFGGLNATQFASADNSLTVPQLESPPNQGAGNEETFGNVQFGQQAGGWGGNLQTPTDGLPVDQTGSENVYSPIQFSSMQTPTIPESRRGSSSEELADSLGNIGINTIRQSQSMSQLPHRMDGATWRHTEKELDIAARRKRPRPAAIGTSGSTRSLVGPSSMSPTTRNPSFGAGHVLRHVKSTQNLGSRYAGVRKLSSAQRSPFGISSFAEAGVLNSANANMLPPSVSASSLAPPTPLTPEDLQNLLPSTPSENKYCVSGHRNQSQLFPTTQPMQLNIASPPSTPLTTDPFSQMQYQNLAPPLSAPAHCTSFPEFSPSSGPLTGRSWADAAPMPSPENSSFQSSIHMPQPTHVSPITYGQSNDQYNQGMDNWQFSSSSPPLGPISESNTSGPTTIGDQKATEFLIHEFPKQQEAHRFVAQQLPPQKPKNYTFANQTPSDF
ncbi:hypothetical protein VTN00DRAFT_9825 [Thermoascus crustaceus]|uniref:uncharacterized protein n=1 Tax=Thermoascus crustaceus TaxID=5088 RepID=UPI0037424C1F